MFVFRMYILYFGDYWFEDWKIFFVNIVGSNRIVWLLLRRFKLLILYLGVNFGLWSLFYLYG